MTGSNRFAVWSLTAVGCCLAAAPDSAAQPKAAPKPVPKPGEVREFEIAKGVAMKFCWIPAGTATLGSPETEKRRDKSEEEHEFETAGFWLGKYEVTQAQYQAVTGKTPSWFCATGIGSNKVRDIDTSDMPVESVGWDDAKTFTHSCTTRRVRLPHEDEWEYAYRGGKGNAQPYYWGGSLNGDKANCGHGFPYGTDVKGTYIGRPVNVGSYEKVAPHPWGLCDMSGNVSEWCEGETGDGPERVHRGGGFPGDAVVARGAHRRKDHTRWRVDYIGFRVALSPPAK